MIARVEPLTTTRRLSGPFDYLPPAQPVGVGSVVRIPFGRQRLEGVVTEIATESAVPSDKLVRATDARPDTVPEDLVRLALWMAVEY